jgi:hypothetical protein
MGTFDWWKGKNCRLNLVKYQSRLDGKLLDEACRDQISQFGEGKHKHHRQIVNFAPGKLTQTPAALSKSKP